VSLNLFQNSHVIIQGQEKMSKSDPDSAIFMEDSAADVRQFLKQLQSALIHLILM
jgi:tryptophanyl-tRNA synthetase